MSLKRNNKFYVSFYKAEDITLPYGAKSKVKKCRVLKQEIDAYIEEMRVNNVEYEALYNELKTNNIRLYRDNKKQEYLKPVDGFIYINLYNPDYNDYPSDICFVVSKMAELKIINNSLYSEKERIRLELSALKKDLSDNFNVKFTK